MNEPNFDNILWQSKCNAGKLLLVLCFIPLVLFISIFFAMSIFGFGPVVIVLIILTIASLIFFMVYGRKHRWINPKLIFALTEEGVIFTMKNVDSFFFNEYENISDYTFVKHNEKYATVTLNFRSLANAGSYGIIKNMTMAKIQNFELLQSILEAHNVYCLTDTPSKAK